jgi:hypothetical protein
LLRYFWHIIKPPTPPKPPVDDKPKPPTPPKPPVDDKPKPPTIDCDDFSDPFNVNWLSECITPTPNPGLVSGLGLGSGLGSGVGVGFGVGFGFGFGFGVGAGFCSGILGTLSKQIPMIPTLQFSSSGCAPPVGGLTGVGVGVGVR